MAKKDLSVAERLIVAADFDPKDGTEAVEQQVLGLARKLNGLGVYIKVESILRARGYVLIDYLHEFGLKVFADLKLSGIPQTLTHDGVLLRPHKPELLTVMSPTGRLSMGALKAAVPPETEVLAVTFLTHLKDEDAVTMFDCNTAQEAAEHLAMFAEGLDGLINAPKDLGVLRVQFGDEFTYNTPNIRPAFVKVKGDDQNPDRALTPAEAIAAGADRLVIGRPITQAADPREATLKILEEIQKATSH